jgi:hypothetical protein
VKKSARDKEKRFQKWLRESVRSGAPDPSEWQPLLLDMCRRAFEAGFDAGWGRCYGKHGFGEKQPSKTVTADVFESQGQVFARRQCGHMEWWPESMKLAAIPAACPECGFTEKAN